MSRFTSVLCWSFAQSGAYAAVALTGTPGGVFKLAQLGK
jgi:hypothetical protein